MASSDFNSSLAELGLVRVRVVESISPGAQGSTNQVPSHRITKLPWTPFAAELEAEALAELEKEGHLASL